MLIALGDSLTEGVQSADANRETQPVSYASLVAMQMRGSFPLPLITISPVGVVGSGFLRDRIDPSVVAADLGVSGATVLDTLSTSSEPGHDNEYDLVVSPRITTQVSAAIAKPAPIILYWAGSDDDISAVLDFDKLDASQLANPTAFRANVHTVFQKLKALNKHVVVGNIPELTHIAFVMDANALRRFAGSDFGLPNGSYTTLVTAELLRLGLEDRSILQNPDYVLDPTEMGKIRQSVQDLNGIIASEAASAGFGLVDVYSYMEGLMVNPPTYGGSKLTANYLGGLFSLDGIHPSNISYALLANQFIHVMDAKFGYTVPPFTERQLDEIARHDPFIDHKGNGEVKGRFGAGLLETLAPILGVKHDARHPIQPSAGQKLITEYRTRMHPTKGMTKTEKTAAANAAARPASRDEAHRAMRHIFGLDAIHPPGSTAP